MAGGVCTCGVLASGVTVGVVSISVKAVYQLEQVGNIAVGISRSAALVLVIGDSKFSVF